METKVKAKVTLEYNYYITYKLNGITYVPHYTKPCYVGPKYSAFEGILDPRGNRCFFTSPNREYSSYHLEKAGAIQVAERIWVRSKHKPIM